MAQINLQGDTSGSISIQAPSVAGSNTITLPATTQTLATENALGVRNLIINGDMKIAQRGTSQTGLTNGSNGYYTVDRWKFQEAGAPTYAVTMSQDTDVPTGQGFSNSVKYAITTAQSSLAAADGLLMPQMIEGQMLQHIKKGTSSAESLTLSFWVKSNKTGTYIFELEDADNARNISKSYTIDAADTWEKKTITIDADTTGTLDNDNNASFKCWFWFAAGSNFTSGTLATSWASVTTANRAVGQVNLADSTSNYINITGVQLEVGDTATPFEHRPYDMELARCQRYYYKIDATIAGSYPSTGAYSISTTQAFVHFPFPVVMRTTPTAMETTGTASDYRIVRCGLSTFANCNLVPTLATSMPHMGMGVWNVASGLSNGTAGAGNFATTSGYVGWSAEL